MHEYGIAQDLVRYALVESERCGAEQITALRLAIGSEQDIDPEALSFGVQAAAHGTMAEGVAVEIVPSNQTGIVLESIEVSEATDVRGFPSAGAA